MKKIIPFALLLCSAPFLSAQQGAKINFKTGSTYFHLPPGITESDYLPGTVLMKVKAKFRNECFPNAIQGQPELNSFLSQIGAQNLGKKFPRCQVPEKAYNEHGDKYADLSLVYEFSYSQNIPLEKVINRLYTFGVIEYAQPHYLPKELYTPSDPDIVQPGSYFLASVDAYNAWDIDKGDTSVVIGVTDTGIDMNHPDLVPNMKHNYADPVDGADNDGDGYTDNFTGWDLGEADNNPQSTASHHGTHVSGLCGAKTDNAIGMASTGFKCKIMPIKIMNAAGQLSVAYEGIVYAADHGCKIINCSWGGTAGGQYEQDIIDYATFNKGALVIAAAGNNGTNVVFYPASFKNVLSVAATNNTDTKWVQSNYGKNIDVCAPGENVYSCWQGGAYVPSSGTSMASPVAAGCAAIVRHHFPAFTPLQVGEQLRVTADTIDNIPGNAAYAGLLGHGRVNLFRALSITSLPSVRITKDSVSDNNDNLLVSNDTARLRCNFTSYLATTTNMVVTVSSTSPYLTFLDNSTTIGAVAAINTVNNNADPFVIKVAANTPQNTTALLKFKFTDGSFVDYQYLELSMNIDYINIEINDVATTITSKGRIGYNQDQQTEGLGFVYNGGASLLYEASLMVGNSATKVSDMMRSVNAQDNDFQSVNKVQRILPSVNSEFDVYGKFNDNGNANKLEIETDHFAYAWSSPGNRKYVIVKYAIRNTGNFSLAGLYAGICADWDVGNALANNGDYDAPRKMGYIYTSVQGDPYVGIKLLSGGPALCYNIDNVAGGNGGVDLQSGYTDALKYTTLSNNRFQTNGATDAMHVVSTGPFVLLPGDTLEVGFALLAGDDLADLQAGADSAQQKYNKIVPFNAIGETEQSKALVLYPNPAAEQLTLEQYCDGRNSVTVSIINPIGAKVAEYDKGRLPQGLNRMTVDTRNLSPGIYFMTVTNGSNARTVRFSVAR